jgi:hypothetical protein
MREVFSTSKAAEESTGRHHLRLAGHDGAGAGAEQVSTHVTAQARR